MRTLILTTPTTAFRAATEGQQSPARPVVLGPFAVFRHDAREPFSGRWIALTALSFASFAPPGTANGMPRQEPAAETRRLPDEPRIVRTIRIPMEPDTVVLQMEFSGGLPRRAPADFVPTPRLRVFANGQVETGQNEPDQPVYRFRLTEAELREILDDVVNCRGFLELDQALIEDQLRSAGTGDLIADAPATRIALCLTDQKNEVALHGLRDLALRHPTLDQLQRLWAVAQLCERLCALAEIGGPNRLEPMLVLAQAGLDAQFPGRRVAADHLETAAHLPDGGLLVRFLVPPNAAGTPASSGIAVELQFDAAGQHVSTWSVETDR